jgi:hypothetical protein
MAMGRNAFCLGVLLLAGVSVLLGQGRRIVLLEEATNASCPPCAASNPNLQAFVRSNFGNVVTVRYHAWWPGTDPMYSHNQTENTNRIQYYSINGVPNYLMDGVNCGVPSDPASMAAIARQRLQSPHVADIGIQAAFDADSVRVQVTLIGQGTVTQSSLSLYTAVIERMVVFAAPPGNNGEKVFPDVMRKMLPAATGISVPSLKAGDTLRYTLSTAVSPVWRRDDLAVVSWLQSNATMEVVQANINMPTTTVEYDGEPGGLMEPNHVYTKQHVIHNRNSVPMSLRVAAEATRLPDGWSYQLLYQGSPVDSIIANLDPGDSLVTDLSIAAGSTPGSVKVKVLAVNRDDPYGYGTSVEHFGVIPSGPVLFVDDDGGADSENLYYAAFDSAGISFTSIETADLVAVADKLGIAQFSALFWNVGWGFPAFVPSDVSYMQNFLDAGGNLFIAGQDIGWDVYDGGGSSGFAAARDFYAGYLAARYVSDDAGGTSMTGIAGDVVSDGLAFTLSVPYAPYPEEIAPQSGKNAVNILRYDNGKYGAVRHDGGTYKTVYLGVGLEQIAQPLQRNLLVKRILEWFGITTGIGAEDDGIPAEYALDQNYPNPFNPSTEISYAIAQRGRVTLTVYDMLGREVGALVNEVQSPGRYQITFDAARVATGVYFYRLTSGTFTSIKKMIMMK